MSGVADVVTWSPWESLTGSSPGGSSSPFSSDRTGGSVGNTLANALNSESSSSSSGSDFSFETPDFSDLIPDVDYDALLAEQQAEEERTSALAQIDALYTSKFDAANTATDLINAEINDEMSHAAVAGLDYNMTDATKQKRINNEFASYWTDSQESSLASLVEKYGDNGYTWDLPIERGDSTRATSSKDKTEETSAGGSVKKTKLAAATKTDDDPFGLGNSTILGA